MLGACHVGPNTLQSDENLCPANFAQQVCQLAVLLFSPSMQLATIVGCDRSVVPYASGKVPNYNLGSMKLLSSNPLSRRADLEVSDNNARDTPILDVNMLQLLVFLKLNWSLDWYVTITSNRHHDGL